jgi:hypothetical protein
MHESIDVIRKYTRRFSGISASIQKHFRYLLNTLVTVDEDQYFTDISILTGILPWLYFKLDPVVTERYVSLFNSIRMPLLTCFPVREWIEHSLRTDDKYWNLLDELYDDPIARWKAIQNLGKYYSKDSESNTVLHLMLYLYMMKRFDIHPSSPPPAGLEDSELYDCSEDLIREFTPGSYVYSSQSPDDFILTICFTRWRSQSYYVCTQGETLVWALEEIPKENQNALLVRLIVQNLANWAPITEDSTLQFGMIRTLYVSLQSCGVESFLKQAKPGEIAALGWHLGGYFR